MKQLLKNTFHSLTYLLFCPLCLHCKNLRQQGFLTLCKECFGMIVLESAYGRCPYCFVDQENGCSCIKKRALRRIKSAHCFDILSPLSSCYLQYSLKQKHFFAQSFASFLYLQLKNLSWNEIDAICYFSCSFFERIKNGFDPVHLIVKKLSKHLGIDIIIQITHKKNRFSLKDPVSIFDKNVLFIDAIYQNEELYSNLFEEIFVHRSKDFRILTIFYKNS